MGYFDPKWNSLPTIPNIHVIVPIIAMLIHLSLMIPVLIETRWHEVQEFVQNPNPEQNQSKSLESFIINCTCMGIWVIGTLNFKFILNA